MSVTVPSAEPIADTYTPVSVFGAALIQALAPWMTLHLAWFCDAIGVACDPVYKMVLDTGTDDGTEATIGTIVDGARVTDGYSPGYGSVFDPYRSTQLPYLGQYVGVAVPSDADATLAQSLVLAEAGLARGTNASIIAAVKRNLIGTQSVALLERAYADGTPDAGWFQVIVRPEEAQPVNEIPNPSFEYDSIGDAPAVWGAPSLTGSGSVEMFAVQNGWSASGAKALRITGVGVGAGDELFGGINPTAAGTAGLSYGAQATFNVLSSDTTPELVVTFYDSSSTVLSQVATHGETQTGVQTISVTNLVAPANTAHVNVIWVLVNAGAGAGAVDAYLDAVQLTQVTDGLGAFFDGDSPGCGWLGTPGDSESQRTVTALTDAVNATKMNGLMWTLVQTDGWTISEMEADYSTLTALEAAFRTVSGLEQDIGGT